MLVAVIDEPEPEHRTVAAHRQIADLVDDEQRLGGSRRAVAVRV